MTHSLLSLWLIALSIGVTVNLSRLAFADYPRVQKPASRPADVFALLINLAVLLCVARVLHEGQ